jgi:homoserine/homoserine lactone efflux protein
MEWHVWVTYFVACWLIALSPGSGAVLSMSHGLAYGVRHSSATIAGLQLGLAVVLVIAGVGVGALLVASATAFTVVKVLGAAYLIWLGWKQWRAPVHDAGPAIDEAVLATNASMALSPALPSARERFVIGLMTNLTNPKSIVFMVAVLPQFVNPARPVWLQLLILACTAMAVDTVVMHGYAFLASRARRWMATARAQRNQNRVFGGVLAFMGAALLLFKPSAT